MRLGVKTMRQSALTKLPGRGDQLRRGPALLLLPMINLLAMQKWEKLYSCLRRKRDCTEGMPEYASTAEDMVEHGSSDLHITTGTPPQIRIDGQMTPLKLPTSAADRNQTALLQRPDRCPETQVRRRERTRSFLRRQRACPFPWQCLHAAGRRGRSFPPHSLQNTYV